MVRRRVWVAKDSPRTIAGELQKIVESRGQKTLKIAPTSPHVVWEGFKKIILAHPKKNSIFIVRHDWNFKWDWLLRSDETKKLLAATLKMGLVNTGIKVPHVYNEIHCCIFNVVGYISAGVLDILFRRMASWILSNPTIKKSTNDWLFEIL